MANRDEMNTKWINRMARIIGHANKVKSMISEDRDAIEVLTQLAAVRAALTSLSKVILEEHVNECMSSIQDIEDDQERQETIDALMDVVNQFIK